MYGTDDTINVHNVPYLWYKKYHNYGTNWGREYTINVPQIWYKTWENYNLVVVVGCIDCKTVAIPVQFMFKNIVVDNTMFTRDLSFIIVFCSGFLIIQYVQDTPSIFT